MRTKTNGTSLRKSSRWRWLQPVALLAAILLPGASTTGQTLNFAPPVTADGVRQWVLWLQLSEPQRLAFHELVSVRRSHESELADAREACQEQWLRGAATQPPGGATLRAALQRRAALRTQRSQLDHRLFDDLAPLLTAEQLPALDRVRRARSRNVNRSLLRRSAWGDPVSQLWTAVEDLGDVSPGARYEIDLWDQAVTLALREETEIVDAFFPALARIMHEADRPAFSFRYSKITVSCLCKQQIRRLTGPLHA